MESFSSSTCACAFPKRIAVIGSGVSGLAAASVLSKAGHDVTVYEKNAHVGGHAETLPVYFGNTDKSTSRFVPVDVGFIIFNQCTYTNMIAWFESHGVRFEPSDISFSVSLKNAQGEEIVEWGSDPAALIARRKNLIDPSFFFMLKDMSRFHTDALAFLKEQNGDDEEGYSENVSDETLGAYLKRKAYAQSLIDYYIIPACAAIWSCPREQVVNFPAYFILSYMKNHHLLQVFGRPQWYTISGKVEGEK
jgi:cyclopropane-fatty-acyl-phospholipid synthase